MQKTTIASLVCLCLFAGSALAKPGDSQNLGMKDWGSPSSMIALGGKIYVGTSLGLRVVDKRGTSKALPFKGVVDGTRMGKMAVLNGKLYSIIEETLYEIDSSGKARKLTSEWHHVPAMAALAGKLYVVDSEELYEVDPSTGEYTSLSKDWYNVDGMAEVNGKLYILRRDKLHEVDQRGIAKELDGTWNDASGITAADGKLYIFAYQPTQPGDKLRNEWVLDSFDPATGTRTRLALPKGWDRGSGGKIVALDGKLYMATVESNATLFSLAIK